jgi:hypothetical protein
MAERLTSKQLVQKLGQKVLTSAGEHAVNKAGMKAAEHAAEKLTERLGERLLERVVDRTGAFRTGFQATLILEVSHNTIHNTALGGDCI